MSGRRHFVRIWQASFAAISIAAAGAVCARSWTIVTPYPADTVSGRGIAQFAAFLDQSDKAATFRPAFEAIDTGNALAEIRSGRIAVADVLASKLTDLDPVFALSTLPFAANSVDDAQRLAVLARPIYRAVLARHGLHLLYLSPWPPSGLWLRHRIGQAGDLAGLRIRTYDATSAAVLSALHAQASALPIDALAVQLQAGQLDGVLSSGDGQVGHSLRYTFPYFVALNYAFPLSFALMSEARYHALPRTMRARIDAAATQTERSQWAALPARIAQDHASMHCRGVMIVDPTNTSFAVALHRAAQQPVSRWQAQEPQLAAAIRRRFARDGAAPASPLAAFGAASSASP